MQVRCPIIVLPSPSFAEMLGDVLDLMGGLAVVLLPLWIIAIPGVILFLVLPVVLLLVVAAVPALVVVAIAAPPVLLVRAARRKRSAREQPGVNHELRAGDEAGLVGGEERTASATSLGSIHGTGSRLPAERSAISRGVVPSMAARPSFIGVLTPVGCSETTRILCGASSIAHDLVRPTSPHLRRRVVAKPPHAAQAGDRGVVDDHPALGGIMSGSRGGRRSTRP